MLIEFPRVVLPIASDERGYSLVEMLVAIVTGLVVTMALFAVLTVSTRQSARITNVTQATQLGRLAMTKIVDELHSACLAPGFTPILEESDATHLRFINSYSEEAVISKAYKHKIEWVKEGAKETGTLTDFSYPSNGGNWPNFTFAVAASPAGGVLIASGVKQSKATPIFQYYNYALESSEGAEAGVSTLNTAPLATPLTKETAPTAASVLITFNTAPTENTKPLGASGERTNVDLSSQVTLAFTAPVSNGEGVDSPCQ
jgi:Tfp pilus assembly protein PilW